MFVQTRTVAAGVVVTAMGLCGIAWIDRDQTDKRKQDLWLQTKMTGRELTSRVDASLQRHLFGIEQMAHFWENSSDVTQLEFNHFAASTLGLNPLCLRT